MANTTNTINTRILLRRDTLERWTGSQDVLAYGEPAVSYDTTTKLFSLKVGDGTHNWSQLPFIAVNITDVQGLQTILTNLQNDIDNLDNDKQDKININGILKGTGNGGVAKAVAGTDYQAPLTFDDVPTADSDNPVKSKGIKSELDKKANQSDLTSHTGNTTAHITAAERSTWNGKQAKITASGILKGNGSGGVSAATAGTDYVAPGTTLSHYGITDAKIVDGTITLGSNSITPATLVEGKVPASQLPSYVDDVIEGYYHNGKFYKDAQHTKEISGESDKIYIDITEGAGNKSYRWVSASAGYAEISAQTVYSADETTITLNSNKVFSVLKVPNQLTVGDKKFDGSAAVTIKGNDIPLNTVIESKTNVEEAIAAVNTKASGKITKVSGATANNIPLLTSGGELTDSTKSLASIENDISSKIPKVTNATENHITTFGANGVVKDSGIGIDSVVRTLKVNDTTQTITSGSVNITVPVSGTGDNAVTHNTTNNGLFVDNVTTDIIKNGSLEFVLDGGNAGV